MKYLIVPFIALGIGSAAMAATPATHAEALHKAAKDAKASSAQIHHAADRAKAEKPTKP